MRFWAVAYKYQEDVFYDFAKEEDTMDLNAACFLPTREVAEDFISQQLDHGDYVSVSIELETLQKNGIWSYARGWVKRWDNLIL
ncbi:hypothetical protein [Bacillus cereus group sp. BceL310]|uniref:hypothetical protein n=1 Tax=Bacillus cereus group sp. BceL310 TaxID=3444975 RepID=UPI003EC8136A